MNGREKNKEFKDSCPLVFSLQEYELCLCCHLRVAHTVGVLMRHEWKKNRRKKLELL